MDFFVRVYLCAGGGTGIRVRLRFLCRKAWGFKSPPAHQKLKWRFAAFFVITNKFVLHGAYGVIVALELVELSDSEHNRIGPQIN